MGKKSLFSMRLFSKRSPQRGLVLTAFTLILGILAGCGGSSTNQIASINRVITLADIASFELNNQDETELMGVQLTLYLLGKVIYRN
jgi:predicted component of type VI protein secretion system